MVFEFHGVKNKFFLAIYRNICMHPPDWNLFIETASATVVAARLELSTVATDKYRLPTPVPRKLEEIERRREKSKMLVDILLLLAGLVFSINEPDVDKR